MAQRPVRSTPTRPSLRVERALLREGHRFVAGMDEVGRGALAGPVTVGVVVVHDSTRSAPAGLRDSKLLTPAARDTLAPKVARWAPHWAVGSATAEEIDRFGIIAGLRLAGFRALAAVPVAVDMLVLDGNHDWLTPPPPALLDLAEFEGGRPTPQLPAVLGAPRVRTMIKADLRCTAVAAASVLAKTTRDAEMCRLAASEPGLDPYRWADNKGYSAPEHLAALLKHGPTHWHRRSWRLPGCDDQPDSDLPGIGGRVGQDVP